MSFASDPGRDDGSLPPVNIVVPDDARELERDVLAYRRELRAGRRRQRIARLAGPFRTQGIGGHAAVIPLIAACLAMSLVGGALLSVITMSPAHAPTISDQPTVLTRLPSGNVLLKGKSVPVQSLTSSAIALVPANCGCGAKLQRLAQQASAADVSLYFAGTGDAISQLPALTARYGDDIAVEADDRANVLGAVAHPSGLTVLLVFRDATADVHRGLSAGFTFGPELEKLSQPGAGVGR